MIRRRLLTTALVLAAAGWLTACGGASTPSPRGTAAGPSSGALQGRALSLGDLPAGWVGGQSPSGPALTCLGNLSPLTGSTGKARLAFHQPASGQFLYEDLTSYPTPRATATYARATGSLNDCRKTTFLSGSARGQRATGTVRMLSVPSLGDSSQAYLITETAGTPASAKTITYQVGLVRVGPTLVLIGYGTAGRPATAEFPRIEAKAVTRLTG